MFSEHQNTSRNYFYLQSALTPAKMGVSEHRRRASATMAKVARNQRGRVGTLERQLPESEPVLPGSPIALSSPYRQIAPSGSQFPCLPGGPE